MKVVVFTPVDLVFQILSTNYQNDLFVREKDLSLALSLSLSLSLPLSKGPLLLLLGPGGRRWNLARTVETGGGGVGGGPAETKSNLARFIPLIIGNTKKYFSYYSLGQDTAAAASGGHIF